MRPVNLIPVEDRRGEQRPLRSGPLAYIVVGALVAVLAGVTALVLTNNQISERKSEIVQLEAEDAAAQEQVARLTAYTQFRTLREQRLATIRSLADSRFDWERVMRELSLILPANVWLVDLNASASSSAGAGDASGGGGSGLRSAASGPALQLSGCASGQEAVAGFVTALKDIDGVTRVGLQSSQLAEEQSGSGSSGGSGGGEDSCQTRDFIAQFEIVAVFDAAPVAPTGTEEAPLTATEPEETAGSETESE